MHPHPPLTSLHPHKWDKPTASPPPPPKPNYPSQTPRKSHPSSPSIVPPLSINQSLYQPNPSPTIIPSHQKHNTNGTFISSIPTISPYRPPLGFPAPTRFSRWRGRLTRAWSRGTWLVWVCLPLSNLPTYIQYLPYC